jgi:hypothetical protein
MTKDKGIPNDEVRRPEQTDRTQSFVLSFMVIRHWSFVILASMSQFVRATACDQCETRFVIVATNSTPSRVQGLVNHCTDELRLLSPASMSCTSFSALKFRLSSASGSEKKATRSRFWGNH